MTRPLLTAAWLLVWLTTPVVAQSTPETADSADVLVLDHDFGVVGELVRLFLNDKQVYRAELSTRDVTLQLRPRTAGMRIPRVYPISDSKSPSGSSVVEIYPDQDGEYEIRPVTIQGSKISTRLRLYRDVSESHRRMTVLNQPGWELGIELAGGWHSGFLQSSAAPPPGSSPDAGSDLEACFSARNAPGIPPAQPVRSWPESLIPTRSTQYPLGLHRAPRSDPGAGQAGPLELGAGRVTSVRCRHHCSGFRNAYGLRPWGLCRTAHPKELRRVGLEPPGILLSFLL